MTDKFVIGRVVPLPPLADLHARAIVKDARRVDAIEGVFAEVQAICNRHRNNECAKEISALLTRKVW